MSKTRQEECSMYQMAQSMMIGSAAGAAEVLIDHPFWSMKTRRQKGASMTINPKILYRGLMPNVMSMVPITASQFGAYAAIKSVVNNDNIASMAAGASAALIACPIEMIMTHQGDTGATFANTYKHLVQTKGMRSVYRGLPATMVRDSIFTLAIFSGKTMVKPYVAIENEKVAGTVASITAGVVAAQLTQGVDTVKTIQQAQHKSFKEATLSIYGKHGIMGFFKGGLPRSARVGMAVMIIGEVTERLGSGKI